MSTIILHEVSLPQWEQEVLSFESRHPVQDKFKEILFLTGMDKVLLNLNLNQTS